MTRTRANLCPLLALFAWLGACDDGPNACPAILKFVSVRVTAPEDLVIESVTAENRSVEPCEHDTLGDGPWPGSNTFRCAEQGAGEYEFVVEAADGRRWSQTADIGHNGCNIDDYDDVLFDLTTTEPDD